MLSNCIYSAQTHNASIHCIVHLSIYTSDIMRRDKMGIDEVYSKL